MPLIIGAIVVVLILVWAGVEIDKVVTAHPAETIFAVSSVAVIVVSVSVARVYASLHDRVPLDRPARGTVIEAAPVRPAIRPAAPAPRPEVPPLPPAATPPRTGQECDGPGCREILDDSPWDCGGSMPDGHQVSGQFHSKACVEAWQVLMAERHKAPRS
jgi:hypothetical protein